MPKRPARADATWKGVHKALYLQFFPGFKPRAIDETFPLVRIALSFVANTLLSIIMIGRDDR